MSHGVFDSGSLVCYQASRQSNAERCSVFFSFLSYMVLCRALQSTRALPTSYTGPDDQVSTWAPRTTTLCSWHCQSLIRTCRVKEAPSAITTGCNITLAGLWRHVVQYVAAVAAKAWVCVYVCVQLSGLDMTFQTLILCLSQIILIFDWFYSESVYVCVSDTSKFALGRLCTQRMVNYVVVVSTCMVCQKWLAWPWWYYSCFRVTD